MDQLSEIKRLGRIYKRSLQEAMKDRSASTLRTLVAAAKYFPEWRKYLELRERSLECGIPWITFEATKKLDKLISKNSRVFEYGSGGSTVWYAKKAGSVVAVENDPVWADKVKKWLDKSGIKNAEVLCVEGEPARSELDPSDPDLYGTGASNYRAMKFEKYVTAIEPHPAGYFDFVVIDGRARPSCLKHAAAKTKPGGFVVLDNSERDYYSKGADLLSGWRKRDYFGPGPFNEYFWKTTIWRKPA